MIVDIHSHELLWTVERKKHIFITSWVRTPHQRFCLSIPEQLYRGAVEHTGFSTTNLKDVGCLQGVGV